MNKQLFESMDYGTKVVIDCWHNKWLQDLSIQQSSLRYAQCYRDLQVLLRWSSNLLAIFFHLILIDIEGCVYNFFYMKKEDKVNCAWVFYLFEVDITCICWVYMAGLWVDKIVLYVHQLFVLVLYFLPIAMLLWRLGPVYAWPILFEYYDHEIDIYWQ